MKLNTSDKTTAFSKKKLSFILPAVLTGLLVFDMIPQTQVTLQEIPERLALVEEVAADTGSDTSGQSEAGGLKRAENEKEDGEQAIGDYEDGVYTGTSQGYGGPVTVEVTVKDGQITDVKIVSAAGETEPYFSLAKTVIDQVMQKQTWEVDVASGATYSSRGILGAIQNALTGETVENAAAPKVEPQGTTQQDAYKDPDAYKDGTYTGTAQGFGGPITVKVVVKNGKIDSISIESAGGETASYLNRAKGVISSILKKGSPNVDTVSGATYSSTGIINAVKRALSKASADGSKKNTKEKKQKKSKKTASTSTPAKQDTYTEPAAYKDGTYYGTADGFGGEIKVKVVISGGKLTGITIENADGETAEYLTKAKAVINTMLQKGSPNVDSISGATYSSTGIINAVKRAMSQAAMTGGTNQSAAVTQAAPVNPTVPSDPSVMPAETLKDGVYTGTGEGFGGDIVVQLTVSGGRMTDIQITSAEDETPAYFNRAKGLVATILSRQSTDVDMVSGATYSSRGIIEAVKKAAAQASGTEEKPDDGSENQGSGGHEGGGASGGTGESGKITYKDGTYTERGWCVEEYRMFEYEIIVQITVKDGIIKSCNVDIGEDKSEDWEENEYFIDHAVNGAKGIPAQIVSKQSADVDGVSGATYTSNTIKNLAAVILNKIKVTAAEETKESSSAKNAKAKGSDKESAELAADAQDDVSKPVEAGDETAQAEDPAADQSESDSSVDGNTADQNNEAEETTEKQSVEDSETENSEQSDEKASREEETKAKGETEKKKAEEEVKKKAEAEAKKKAEEEAKKKAEEAKKKAEEEAKKKAEEEAKKKAEAEAKAKAAEEEAVAKAKAAAQAAQAEKAAADDEKDT
ncbi:MAG: FMN-binding protein [Eubacterium sp.]|nr:FMN-binding protein [Eubacterium sp.]